MATEAYIPSVPYTGHTFDPNNDSQLEFIAFRTKNTQTFKVFLQIQDEAFPISAAKFVNPKPGVSEFLEIKLSEMSYSSNL